MASLAEAFVLLPKKEQEEIAMRHIADTFFQAVVVGETGNKKRGLRLAEAASRHGFVRALSRSNQAKVRQRLKLVKSLLNTEDK